MQQNSKRVAEIQRGVEELDEVFSNWHFPEVIVLTLQVVFFSRSIKIL
jgi:hypothetical protein